MLLTRKKAVNVMLYLARKAGGSIDFSKLVKLVYFADKKHLHEWGRTITGDKYVKMEHGVTPSATYDMLKAVRGDKDWPRTWERISEWSGVKRLFPSLIRT